MDVMEPVLEAVVDEAYTAQKRYGPPASTQESLGVLLEEFEELREAIHDNMAGRIASEAVQVAAVAYRLALAISHEVPEFYRRSGLTMRAA